MSIYSIYKSLGYKFQITNLTPTKKLVVNPVSWA